MPWRSVKDDAVAEHGTTGTHDTSDGGGRTSPIMRLVIGDHCTVTVHGHLCHMICNLSSTCTTCSEQAHTSFPYIGTQTVLFELLLSNKLQQSPLSGTGCSPDQELALMLGAGCQEVHCMMPAGATHPYRCH